MFSPVSVTNKHSISVGEDCSGFDKITFEQPVRFENQAGDNLENSTETGPDEDILKSAKNNQISGSTYWKWRCPECGKQLSNRSSLFTHRQTMHLGEVKFFCSKCEYRTKRNCHLTEHVQKMHEKGSKYQINKMGQFSCNQCEKSFSSGKSISLHQRVHTTCLKAGQSL